MTSVSFESLCDINRRNYDVQRIVIDWLRMRRIIILRLNLNEDGILTGDIDAFVRRTELSGVLDDLRSSIAQFDLGVWFERTLSGINLFIVKKDFRGFLRLDLHFREVYRNVSVMSSSKLQENVWVDEHGLTRVSPTYNHWLSLCFYTLNGDVNNHKLLEAHKYFDSSAPQPKNIQLLLGQLFTSINTRPLFLRRFLLYSLLFCLSILSIDKFIDINYSYFRYAYFRFKAGPLNLYCNNICSEENKSLLSLYFRGQPVCFEVPDNALTPNIIFGSASALVDSAEKCGASLVKQFLTSKSEFPMLAVSK